MVFILQCISSRKVHFECINLIEAERPLLTNLRLNFVGSSQYLHKNAAYIITTLLSAVYYSLFGHAESFQKSQTAGSTEVSYSVPPEEDGVYIGLAEELYVKCSTVDTNI